MRLGNGAYGTTLFRGRYVIGDTVSRAPTSELKKTVTYRLHDSRACAPFVRMTISYVRAFRVGRVRYTAVKP